MTPWSSLAAILAVLLAGQLCAAPERETTELAAARHRFEKPCMGTLFTIVIYSNRPAEKIEAAANAAFEIGGKLDAELSDYRRDSEVGGFNHSKPGTPLRLSPTLADILSRSAEIAQATEGAFDPTRGALTRLWRLSKRTGKLPSREEITRAKLASGLDRMTIDLKTSTITRHSPHTRLDFGGIAKGFAADRMLAFLKERGLGSASVAAGGDVAAGDPPPGRLGWKVEIRAHGDDQAPRTVVEIANAAVSTSGNVEQSIEIDGVRYSHLIDHRTGLGMLAQRAATVIAPSATESDALATALCLLGKDSIAIIEKRPKSEAAIFSLAPTGQQKATLSSGFGAFSP
jgi:thiamine biosynthesis lipoprotein